MLDRCCGYGHLAGIPMKRLIYVTVLFFCVSVDANDVTWRGTVPYQVKKITNVTIQEGDLYFQIGNIAYKEKILSEVQNQFSSTIISKRGRLIRLSL